MMYENQKAKADYIASFLIVINIERAGHFQPSAQCTSSLHDRINSVVDDDKRDTCITF